MAAAVAQDKEGNLLIDPTLAEEEVCTHTHMPKNPGDDNPWDSRAFFTIRMKESKGVGIV